MPRGRGGLEAGPRAAPRGGGASASAAAARCADAHGSVGRPHNCRRGRGGRRCDAAHEEERPGLPGGERLGLDGAAEARHARFRPAGAESESPGKLRQKISYLVASSRKRETVANNFRLGRPHAWKRPPYMYLSYFPKEKPCPKMLNPLKCVLRRTDITTLRSYLASFCPLEQAADRLQLIARQTKP